MRYRLSRRVYTKFSTLAFQRNDCDTILSTILFLGELNECIPSID